MSAARGALAGAVIAFDLDGTLVDTAPDLIGTLNTILAEQGHPALSLEAGRPMIGRGARAMLEQGFSASGVTKTPEDLASDFDHFINIYLGRIARESRPFPGVAEALEQLAAAGARLAVCTNKRTFLSLALLDALGLTRHFASVMGPDTAGVAKPDPAHLIAALTAAGGSVTHALMVGDSKTDYDAARAAGVPVVLVSFGYTDIPARDLGADALIDHFDELPRIAQRLLAACPAPIPKL